MVRGLPDHESVLVRLLEWSQGCPEIVGAILSGSAATGGLDQWSDLDVGFVCSGAAERERLWSERWSWEVADWMHRFDADHVKAHFVIYWFEPGVQTDIALYTPDELPVPAGAPYRVAWDAIGSLTSWAGQLDAAPQGELDWSATWHEDERFWAWTFYCVRHIQRGEYYHVALEFHFLRGIIEQWHARLSGQALFPGRHTEVRCDPEFLARLAPCFPRADRDSLKQGLLQLIELQHDLRFRISQLADVCWRTRDDARVRIEQSVRGL